MFSSRCKLALLLVAALVLPQMVVSRVIAKVSGGFAGVEYLSDDSQTSRMELEKMLGLRHGASYESAERAISRLREKLEQKRLKANLDIVDGDKDEFYVSIDIVRTGVPGDAPTRRLEFPRRIFLSSQRPLQLLEQLEARRLKLQEEGRPTDVVYKDGVKHYTDGPCDVLVGQLLLATPKVRGEIFQMIASDPDPKRRMAGIELLGWAGEPVRDCAQVVPAINDVDPDVRVVAAKYVAARMELLPDKFPWTQMIEAYAFQLARPSHRDRMAGLYALSALIKQRPETMYNVKVYSEERLKQLVEQSSIPAIKAGSEQLLAKVANVKVPKGGSSMGSGF